MIADLRGVLLLALLAGVGCGKAVDSSGSLDAGGDDGDDSGDDVGDIDASADDGEEIDAAVEGPMLGRIVVFTRNYTDSVTGDNPLDSTVSARFGDFETESCVEELDDGDCRVLACTPREPSTRQPDAGDISIQGVQDAVISPQSSGLYEDLEVDRTLLSDGGNLSVFAGGGAIGAFAIEDLVVPYSNGFQPGTVPTAATPIAVSAGAGWALSWGGIDPSDTFRFTLTATAADGEGVTRRAECSLGAGAGGTTVSPDVLNLLPQGPLSFEAVSERATTAQVGEYEIELVARVVTRDGDDANADWARGTVDLGP